MSGKIIGMTLQATKRKIKRSFTLTPESIALVRETRRRRRTGSDSEALDLLLREAIDAQKREKIDAAIKRYYDSADAADLEAQREWAEGTAANMWSGKPE